MQSKWDVFSGEMLQFKFFKCSFFSYFKHHNSYQFTSFHWVAAEILAVQLILWCVLVNKDPVSQVW